MSVEQNKKFMRELKKEHTCKIKLIRHIWYCEYQIRSTHHKRTYYFRKQIEVARRKI